MRKYFLLSSLSMSLILAGCAAPDNIKPHNQLIDGKSIQSDASLAHLTQAQWPTDDWWTHLQDPQLNQLIREALQQSPDLQLANARVMQAEAFIDQADSKFEPTMSASAGVTRARQSKLDDYTLVGDRYGTSRHVGVNFDYSFDLWGGKRDAWEASVNNAKAAEVDRQAAKVMLSTSITRTYVQLANAYMMEDLAKKDLARTTNMADITNRLLKNGLTSDDRLYTAQSAAAIAKQALKQRSLTVAQLKNTLAALTGAGPDRAMTITRPVVNVANPLALPKNLPADLLSHRPEIVAAKWRVEAADKQISAAKTQFYPNIDLSASAGVKSLVGDSFFGRTSKYWTVGPALSLPIFTGELKANLKTQTAGYDTAVAQYNQSVINAFHDVSDKVLTLQSVSQQILDAQDSMSLAEKSYQITENRYNSGMGSQLEVLMAEQQLLQAESLFTTLRSQQQDAQIQLIQALGGGFTAPANETKKHS